MADASSVRIHRCMNESSDGDKMPDKMDGVENTWSKVKFGALNRGYGLCPQRYP